MLFSNESGHLKSVFVPTLYDITKDYFRAHLKKDGFEWYLDNMHEPYRKSLIDDMGIGVDMRLQNGCETVTYIASDEFGVKFERSISFGVKGTLMSVTIDRWQRLMPQHAYLIDGKTHYDIYMMNNEKGKLFIRKGSRVGDILLTEDAVKENHQDIIDMIEKKRQDLTAECRKIMDERKAKFEALKARLGIR